MVGVLLLVIDILMGRAHETRLTHTHTFTQQTLPHVVSGVLDTRTSGIWEKQLS